jgi:hypothetical protein
VLVVYQHVSDGAVSAFTSCGDFCARNNCTYSAWICTHQVGHIGLISGVMLMKTRCRSDKLYITIHSTNSGKLNGEDYPVVTYLPYAVRYRWHTSICELRNSCSARKSSLSCFLLISVPTASNMSMFSTKPLFCCVRLILLTQCQSISIISRANRQ